MSLTTGYFESTFVTLTSTATALVWRQGQRHYKKQLVTTLVKIAFLSEKFQTIIAGWWRRSLPPPAGVCIGRTLKRYRPPVDDAVLSREVASRRNIRACRAYTGQLVDYLANGLCSTASSAWGLSVRESLRRDSLTALTLCRFKEPLVSQAIVSTICLLHLLQALINDTTPSPVTYWTLKEWPLKQRCNGINSPRVTSSTRSNSHRNCNVVPVQ